MACQGTCLLLSYLKNCQKDQARPKNKTREMRISTKLYKMRGAPNSNKSKANMHFHRKIKGQKGRNCATYIFNAFVFCSIFLLSRRCELNVTCVARTQIWNALVFNLYSFESVKPVVLFSTGLTFLRFPLWNPSVCSRKVFLVNRITKG